MDPKVFMYSFSACFATKGTSTSFCLEEITSLPPNFQIPPSFFCPIIQTPTLFIYLKKTPLRTIKSSHQIDIISVSNKILSPSRKPPALPETAAPRHAPNMSLCLLLAKPCTLCT
ncbi:hypothetical protein AMTRI_Chr01g126210 [Amborella trichopoda]